MGQCKVSIEILAHFTCGSCGKWWSVGDRVPQLGQTVHCPDCGVEQSVSEMINGKNELIQGVKWQKLGDPILVETPEETYLVPGYTVKMEEPFPSKSDHLSTVDATDLILMHPAFMDWESRRDEQGDDSLDIDDVVD